METSRGNQTLELTTLSIPKEGLKHNVQLSVIIVLSSENSLKLSPFFEIIVV